MKTLIRTAAAGGSQRQEIEAPALRLGRDAGQDLVLGDLRVALQHAEITQRQGLMGPVFRVEAKSRLGVWLNGIPVQAADLSVGDRLALGRYRLRVGKAERGFDLVLELEETAAGKEQRQARIAALRTSLADTGWSRRRLSWLLFLGLLLLGLGLPLASYWQTPVAEAPASREMKPRAAPGADILWSSGPLSSAHHALQADCNSCHRLPFESVRDESCLGCHQALGDHAASRTVRAEPLFSGQRCTDCHREHLETAALVPASDQVCTDCHTDPSALPGKKLLPVADWSRDHPAFSVRLARRSASGEPPFRWPAFRQGEPEAQREDSGLKFSHAQHLTTKGIDAPGGVKVMNCGDCHRATADGQGFQPIRMESHCADCHRLDFDPAAPDRRLPHGDPEEVQQVVRDYYARQALAGGLNDPRARPELQQRRRPGESLRPAASRAALEWADARAALTLRDLFERRSCHSCHEVSRSKDGDWQIAPVAAEQPAFGTVPFPHDQHATERCETCHAATDSKLSTEVLLPDIARCRDCHGDTGAMTETPTRCQSCHAYHQHPATAAVAP